MAVFQVLRSDGMFMTHVFPSTEQVGESSQPPGNLMQPALWALLYQPDPDQTAQLCVSALCVSAQCPVHCCTGELAETQVHFLA